MHEAFEHKGKEEYKTGDESSMDILADQAQEIKKNQRENMEITVLSKK